MVAIWKLNTLPPHGINGHFPTCNGRNLYHFTGYPCDMEVTGAEFLLELRHLIFRRLCNYLAQFRRFPTTVLCVDRPISCGFYRKARPISTAYVASKHSST